MRATWRWRAPVDSADPTGVTTGITTGVTTEVTTEVTTAVATGVTTGVTTGVSGKVVCQGDKMAKQTIHHFLYIVTLTG